MIDTAGAAVYGRTTYDMMRGYWPSLLDKPDADPAQRTHARWVEQIPKLTFSRTPGEPATGTMCICAAMRARLSR